MIAANPVLDLADFAPAPRRAAGTAQLPRRVALAVVVAGLIVAVLASVPWRDLAERSGLVAAPGQVLRIPLDAARKVAEMTVDDRSQILAEGTDAQSRNAAIPFAAGAAPVARAFLLNVAAPTAANALRCLTQAVYYEAANEPIEGRRAVAQVVLNRMRHPAYPKSVCGVVYQGAERMTGCQFSFTCDGALLRTPMARPWHEAEQVAREALAGRVEESVGTATHYHADYVLPRWAFTLAKINQLGRHLFYRFEGAWGRPAAFTGHYSASETIPALDFNRLRARLISDGSTAPVTESFAHGLTVAPHVTDRHADNDVGGRLDMTRIWRLTIPDPGASSSRYRALLNGDAPTSSASPVGTAPALAQTAQGGTATLAAAVEGKP